MSYRLGVWPRWQNSDGKLFPRWPLGRRLDLAPALALSARNLIPLELVVERRAVDAQGGGGFLYVSALALQGRHDGLALELRQGQVGHLPGLELSHAPLQ